MDAVKQAIFRTIDTLIMVGVIATCILIWVASTNAKRQHGELMHEYKKLAKQNELIIQQNEGLLRVNAYLTEENAKLRKKY